MDRKHIIRWAAIIGLLTALIALGTAFMALTNELARSRQSNEDQQRRIVEYQEKLNSDREAYEARRRADLAALQQAIRAQQRAGLCVEHGSRREGIESRFSDLMQSHGTLMNAMQRCFVNSTGDDRGRCLLIVCAGAAALTNGRANCLAVGADAAAIREDLVRENELSQRDDCPVPSSAVTTFFN